MARLTFNEFAIAQSTFEIRYDPAYLLWDVAGKIWTRAGKLFKTLEPTNVAPSSIGFLCDNRFSVAVQVDRAFAIDTLPAPTTIPAEFIEIVLEELPIPLLSRIGTRLQYAVRCGSAAEAAERLRATFTNFPSTLFDLPSARMKPSIRLDGEDEELGFMIQISHRHRTAKVNMTPEMLDLVPAAEVRKWERHEIVIDVDQYTVAKTLRGSFSAASWIQRCEKQAPSAVTKLLELYK